MLRRTSEYTLRFGAPVSGAGMNAHTDLDNVVAALKDLLDKPEQMSGSGASVASSFVQFRVSGDEEAQRVARALIARTPMPRYGYPVLTTGQGVNYRHLSI